MAVFSANLDGLITASNSVFSELGGYASQQLLGRNLSTLFSQDGSSGKQDQSQLQKTILAAAGNPAGYQENLFLQTADGNRLRVQLSATLMRDSASLPAAVVVFVSPLAEPAAAPAISASIADSEVAPGVVARKIDDTQFILASPVMHKFIGLVDRVAGHTETVLVTGETGTGKELIARTIHESSHRRSRPWVDINCAALPENLVESELFGYEKGAFSGADASKPGLFELADKGTLFLDEIGELQPQTQVKLLRVLDGQPFYRLGWTSQDQSGCPHCCGHQPGSRSGGQRGPIPAGPFSSPGAISAACSAVARASGGHRRARGTFSDGSRRRGKHFSSQAISALLSHSWPGNIRELRNLVAKMAMESSGSEIDFSRLNAALTGEPAALRQTASMPVSNLDSMEEQMIIKALERTGGHRTLAAEQLGISRRTLSRKLKEYNINFAPGESSASLGFISNEQQKFFRTRVQIPVTVKNARGDRNLRTERQPQHRRHGSRRHERAAAFCGIARHQLRPARK